MSDGGKGSSPRPYSVDHSTFESNWDRIFGKKQKIDDNTGTSNNEYYDMLTTEDCFEEGDNEA